MSSTPHGVRRHRRVPLEVRQRALDRRVFRIRPHFFSVYALNAVCALRRSMVRSLAVHSVVHEPSRFCERSRNSTPRAMHSPIAAWSGPKSGSTLNGRTWGVLEERQGEQEQRARHHREAASSARSASLPAANTS
jgi:hypothetical protein